MNSATVMQWVPPCGSLDIYLTTIRRIPLLTPGEERELAIRYRDDGDLESARQLVMSHLRFVVRIAKGYSGYGLAEADLIQEGNLGLMKAVKRFDPDQGVRLVSFAVHWIRAEIYEFILRNWRIVRIATTKQQRKLFFNLRSAKKTLGWLNQEEAEGIAQDLGVSAQEVLRMEARMSARDTSFDPHPEEDEEHKFAAPIRYLEDHRADPARQLELAQTESLAQGSLAAALHGLDPRSRDIISARWLAEDKTTLQDLADRFGISAERVRQLEKAAIAKLRRAMGDLVALAA
jgi:RNA polymerase sigma-32 factor